MSKVILEIPQEEIEYLQRRLCADESCNRFCVAPFVPRYQDEEEVKCSVDLQQYKKVTNKEDLRQELTLAIARRQTKLDFPDCTDKALEPEQIQHRHEYDTAYRQKVTSLVNGIMQIIDKHL